MDLTCNVCPPLAIFPLSVHCVLLFSSNLFPHVQVAPREHWPEMETLVLVVSAQKKPVSSTAGMQTSVLTSSLMRERADVIVPARMREMERAIAERDFETFGKLTMQVGIWEFLFQHS